MIATVEPFCVSPATIFPLTFLRSLRSFRPRLLPAKCVVEPGAEAISDILVNS